MKKGLIAIVAVIALVFMVSQAHAFPAVEIYKQYSPAVVLIVASAGGGSSMIGAGSVITDSGYVITNAHVVINEQTGGPYRKVNVYTRPVEITGDFQRDLKHRHDARVLRYDRKLDLALLKVEGLNKTGVIGLANPRDIMVGEEVVAIGHPEQGGLWTLTYGRISGHKANQGKVKGKDVYQTDTSVNRGNSGGPLLDERGNMVGVNTNIARSGSGGLAITGVNFALKSAVVHNWLEQTHGLSLAYGSSAIVSPAPVQRSAAPAKAEPESKPKPKAVDKKPARVAPAVVKKPAPMKIAPVKVVEKPVKSDTILTPKKPFKTEELYKAVERDMENLLEEMKGSFKKKRRFK